MADKTFTERVIAVQSQLKAPKNQRNNFGGYNYRNCEDILEAVKPLLKAEGLFLTITDDIVVLGDRFYVKATATLTDGERSLSNQAFAREEATKKGMDGSQVTGAASSYARKYALNGLLAIDDTKDADALNNGQDSNNGKATDNSKAKATDNSKAQAIAEVRKAPDLAALNAVYKRHEKALGKDTDFLTECTTRKKQLKQG